jgi:hypothetical protein
VEQQRARTRPLTALHCYTTCAGPAPADLSWVRSTSHTVCIARTRRAAGSLAAAEAPPGSPTSTSLTQLHCNLSARSGMCETCPAGRCAAACAAEMAHKRQDDNKRARRAERRGGRPPKAHHERRLTHADQYEVNRSDASFRHAMRFQCNCQRADCAVVTTELFDQCAQDRHMMNTCCKAGDMASQQLLALLMPARYYQPIDETYAFDKNAAIPIGCTGVVVCPAKARVLFHIADSMWSRLRHALTRQEIPESIWNDNLKPPRDANMSILCRTWIRRHAELVGDIMPTTGNIQLEAMTLRNLHLMFAAETGEFISYSYLCECWKQESQAEYKPILVRAAPAHACLRRHSTLFLTCSLPLPPVLPGAQGRVQPVLGLCVLAGPHRRGAELGQRRPT